ncbi:hypothetical protein HOP50_14g71340 [Chloropicon primus]|uniref:YggT family protein n=2 Tax=Chloropicon primus TaxID=1764295 RepID=A0A5B8MWP5_9CHLO|nr:hypothetical protein A3770_14p71140 [Chloropicon primus]UPR03804.1 hypothetical protein HOP50_14g71340 [Chloropicon primus]|eukprot:QDZ24596.1 hypothetical protein A3770_14p71140 [Chloropicon primus]
MKAGARVRVRGVTLAAVPRGEALRRRQGKRRTAGDATTRLGALGLGPSGTGAEAKWWSWRSESLEEALAKYPDAVGGRGEGQEREDVGGRPGCVGGAAARTAAPAAIALQASLFGTVLDVFYVAVLVRILTSWFPNLPPLLDPVVNLARQITEPVFQPFRQLIPPLRLGNSLVDISGILVIFLINFLRRYA